MENLEIFRNEFKKCESMEKFFEREQCYAIRTEKKNANIFKIFYSELVGNLVKILPKLLLKFNTDNTRMFYRKLNPNLEKFELVCITEETIKKLLRCSDVSKAPGMDEIQPRFLKDGPEVLAKPICDTISLSIKLATFPDKCKIAKLAPLFKEGSKTDPKNYKPISLLPLISKLIQKLVHIQTQEYLDKKWLNLQISVRLQEKIFD